MFYIINTHISIYYYYGFYIYSGYATHLGHMLLKDFFSFITAIK